MSLFLFTWVKVVSLPEGGLQSTDLTNLHTFEEKREYFQRMGELTEEETLKQDSPTWSNTVSLFLSLRPPAASRGTETPKA